MKPLYEERQQCSMKDKARSYSIAPMALLLLLSGWAAVSCQAVPSPPAPVPPADQPLPVESQPPEEVPAVVEAADGEEWKTVEVFTGKDNETTRLFHISGTEWRVMWTTEAEYPEYALLDLFIYSEGSHSLPAMRISCSGDSAGDTVYISEGGQSYHFKVIAANLRGWSVTVQEHADKASLSPVQITRVYYKGRSWCWDTICYQIVGTDRCLTPQELHEGVVPPDVTAGEEAMKWLANNVSIHYPILEADEYVEIKNQSDSWQDIGGWVLKNTTKGYPSFIFPSLCPGSSEYCDLPACVHPGEIHPEHCGPPAHCPIAPHHSIRVYTGEVHPESGGFRFSYPPGDIWDDENADVAVLYDSGGREVSRHSYIVLAEDEVLAGK